MSSITHLKVSEVTDGEVEAEVQPSDWNADHATTETDTSLVLAPDGDGGVEFRAESGMPNPMTAVGDLIIETAAGTIGDDVAPSATPTSNHDNAGDYGSGVTAVIDGNDTTLFRPNNTDPPVYVWLDFGGSPPTVGAYRVLQSAISSSARDYELDYSDNNSIWTWAASGVTADADSGIVTFPSVQTHRYWRLVSTSGGGVGSDYWNIYTISLFEVSIGPARLPYDADGKVLTGVAGVPAWSDPASVAEIADSATAEMDTSTVLAPDGVGGVEFRGPTPACLGAANGTLGSDVATSGTDLVDILSVTFTAPDSGQVLVTISAPFTCTGGWNFYWGVHEGTGASLAEICMWSGGGATYFATVSFLVTGLTAGAHTFLWYQRTNGGGSAYVQGGHGQPLSLTVFEAWTP